MQRNHAPASSTHIATSQPISVRRSPHRSLAAPPYSSRHSWGNTPMVNSTPANRPLIPVAVQATAKYINLVPRADTVSAASQPVNPFDNNPPCSDTALKQASPSAAGTACTVSRDCSGDPKRRGQPGSPHQVLT